MDTKPPPIFHQNPFIWSWSMLANRGNHFSYMIYNLTASMVSFYLSHSWPICCILQMAYDESNRIKSFNQIHWLRISTFIYIMAMCVCVCVHAQMFPSHMYYGTSNQTLLLYCQRKTENERVRARGRVFYQSAKVETETYEGLFVLSENHDWTTTILSTLHQVSSFHGFFLVSISC